MIAPTFSEKITPFLWVVLPVAIWLYTPLNSVPALEWEKEMSRERNFIEYATVGFLALAVVFSLLVLFLRARSLLQRIVVGMFTAGCIYFCGEELSWGQHVFHWQTPEEWAGRNVQEETNLHNLDGPWRVVFLSLPRFLLSWGAVVATLVVPFWLSRGGRRFLEAQRWNYWFWPSRRAGLVAVLAVGTNFPVDILEMAGVEVDVKIPGGTGEAKECLLGIFLLLYGWVWFRWQGWEEAARSNGANGG